MFTYFYLVAEVFLRHVFFTDPDVFLHVSVGRWILTHGQFPVFDTFSHTAFGEVWRATDWISEVVIALLYRWGGWSALAQGVSVSIGAVAAILGFYFAKRLRFTVAIGLTVIIILEIGSHFVARPVVFTYPILLIWVMVILDIYDRNRWCESYAYILIPIMVFWANCYAGFTLGLVIFYIFVSDAIFTTYRNKDIRGVKRQLVLALGVTLACMATPYGVFPALKVVQLLRLSALSQIMEWAAPNFQHDYIHLTFFVGLLVLVLFFGIRLRGARLLTFVLMTVAALQHFRSLILFALVVPLLMLPSLSEAIPWVRVSANVGDPVAAFAAKRSFIISSICAMLVVFGGGAVLLLRPTITLPKLFVPTAAINAAKRADLHGNVFNDYGFGGYLIFKGIPPFIDGRATLYGNEFLKEYTRIMRAQDPSKALQVLRKYGVQWALLRPGEPIAHVLQNDGWRQVYEGKNAIVLAKRN